MHASTSVVLVVLTDGVAAAVEQPSLLVLEWVVHAPVEFEPDDVVVYEIVRADEIDSLTPLDPRPIRGDDVPCVCGCPSDRVVGGGAVDVDAVPGVTLRLWGWILTRGWVREDHADVVALDRRVR
jgi:hypothetical protein